MTHTTIKRLAPRLLGLLAVPLLIGLLVRSSSPPPVMEAPAAEPDYKATQARPLTLYAFQSLLLATVVVPFLYLLDSVYDLHDQITRHPSYAIALTVLLFGLTATIIGFPLAQARRMSAPSNERHALAHQARGNVISLIGQLAVVGGLLVAAQQFVAANRQVDIAQYANAIQELSSQYVATRRLGIETLLTVGEKDRARRQDIVSSLSDFVRANATMQSEAICSKGGLYLSPCEDVLLALRTIARLNSYGYSRSGSINLQNIYLRNWHANHENLSGINFANSTLFHMVSMNSCLVTDIFTEAHLQYSRFDGADLRGAMLDNVYVEGVHYDGAYIVGARVGKMNGVAYGRGLGDAIAVAGQYREASVCRNTHG